MILNRSTFRCTHCREKVLSEDLFAHLRDEHRRNGIRPTDYELVYTWRGSAPRQPTNDQVPGQQPLWE